MEKESLEALITKYKAFPEGAKAEIMAWMSERAYSWGKSEDTDLIELSALVDTVKEILKCLETKL